MAIDAARPDAGRLLRALGDHGVTHVVGLPDNAAAATTGTLVVSTGEGKSRIPTVLPPNHIAIINLDQLLPRMEDWLKQEREGGEQHITSSANLCFISGPSRTADIEKQLVLGVHGPRRLQVIVKR